MIAVDIAFYIVTALTTGIVLAHYFLIWLWKHDEVLDEERNA